ncbi:response regulator [Kaistia dalseonensis]|uniref:histidine kinase n=2 Tax=Kaistia dalseonensis TaxID=410840 RepID=A0ABU0HBJ8_9HYPH|nr:response regulator [Kaistia dalseonensis]MCX5497045.1 response regulator [Kaistia dalseonensis]MDQ0439671.1 two-component system cell cycle sensor histidine kinase/response regulator CckA [Kaistia dalseonensis]
METRLPIIDRSDRPSGIGRLVVLAAGLVGAALAFALLPPAAAEPFVFGLLGLLAVIGVFTLFAAAIGLVRIGGRAPRDELARGFIDSMVEGLVVTDRDGRILYANRSYADLIGADDERDVRAVERVFSGDQAASEAIYRLSQAVREGRSGIEEVRMPRPLSGAMSGTPRWYRIRVRPVAISADGDKSSHGRGGDRFLTAWRVADVTADREQQETVFQDLQHAIDYLDHAPAGFLSAEPDGRIVYLNATLAEWLGIDLTFFRPGSLSLKDIVRGDAVALLAGGRSSPGGTQTEIVDLDLVKHNGQSLPVRLLHKVPYASDGAPGATRTVVLNRGPGEDISEALRAAEVRFARFFNHTPFAIASIDKSGRVGRTNAAFAHLFGPAKRDGGTRVRLTDLVGDAGRAALQDALEAAAGGRGDIPPVDTSIAGAGDRSVRFYVSAVDEEASDSEIATVYALDTTEQRALEVQFAQSQKMESIGQLAGGVAHDFNNVLTAIIGFSDLLLANHRPSDPSFQDIMNIKQNANRAAGLVRQLLAFSRRQTLRPQVLAIGDVLSDLSILLDRLLGEKVALSVVHGRDVWPIKADMNQFEQVVINLAVNARDAMPKGGQLTIRTRNVTAEDTASYGYKALPAADYVLIEVEDTGTGIPIEVQSKIFEPFFSTKEVGKGTGLGLSTVYGIVRQTGAHIFFDSELDKGTVFRIFVPRHIPLEQPKVEAVVEKPVELADLTGSAHILLVEDEEAVRAFAARALASRGYTVHEAASGVEALEIMKETGGEIDLVVSDVVMPELDGPSLLRELRKQRPGIKIIFVSGYAEDAFAKNLPDGEAFNFLPKPFSLKQLATAVKEALGE